MAKANNSRSAVSGSRKKVATAIRTKPPINRTSSSNILFTHNLTPEAVSKALHNAEFHLEQTFFHFQAIHKFAFKMMEHNLGENLHLAMAVQALAEIGGRECRNGQKQIAEITGNVVDDDPMAQIAKNDECDD